MTTAVGIAAYNEGQNIGKLLDKLIKDPSIDDIVVIASGCTDNTVEIAQSYKQVKTFVQFKREGKASAVNVFLNYCQNELKPDILILQSADTLPCNFTYKYLLAPFEDKVVGMVGCHPIPVNDLQSRINRVGHLLWATHHYMALRYPKAGEVCAFRNIVPSINVKTAVDEASIEYQIVKQGYKVVYAPDAIIFNKAPLTVRDFMKQRERIFLGHMQLKDEGYQVTTMKQLDVLRAALQASKNPGDLIYGAWLEYLSRYHAKSAYVDNRESHIWGMVDSTKRL